MFASIVTNPEFNDSSYIQLLFLLTAIAPTFDKPLQNNQPAPRDGTVIIKCEPDAAPKPTFEWFKGDGTPITTGGRYTILESGNLQIIDVIDDDGGEYRCVASNTEGSSESTGSLVIKGMY